MTIEFGHYGFMLDTKYCYIALSWELIVVMSVLGATLWAYKKWSNRK
jgi:hypothetical protein